MSKTKINKSLSKLETADNHHNMTKNIYEKSTASIIFNDEKQCFYM